MGLGLGLGLGLANPTANLSHSRVVTSACPACGRKARSPDSSPAAPAATPAAAPRAAAATDW